jgi:Fe-S-cluster containining protein
MNLNAKIRATTRIFNEADRHVEKFRRTSGLGCVSGCHMCCLNPNIHATVMEFIPLATALVDAGRHEDILARIESRKEKICVIFNPLTGPGSCSMYEHRGLICRLFGFTARTTREGTPQLVTCEPIKRNMEKTPELSAITLAPQMPAYYMKLYGIDPLLSIRYMPINESIEQAIHHVAMGTKFRKKRA